MTVPVDIPPTMQINAWNPEGDNRGALAPIGRFAARRQVMSEQLRRFKRVLAPPVPVPLEDWRHPEVGWGLVLPDDDSIPVQARARGDDAPEPLRRLLAARPGSPVLRWSPHLQQLALRRYYDDGTAQDLLIATPTYGVARGCIPHYLLIYAAPSAIPWSVQYALNLALCVGRLDLAVEEGLGNYVDALLRDWAGAKSDVHAPVIWSTDHGSDDITWLMARAIANPLMEKYRADPDLAQVAHLKAAQASGVNLLTELTARRPGLVVTTSHGMTGPLSDAAALTAQLGLLVDADHQPVPLAQMKEWAPEGALWYAHACCAAGSDEASRYVDLLDVSGGAGRIVRDVAAHAGARIAPLPRMLLGQPAPLRAFVGHVEPTFDWTLRQPESGQVTTRALVDALYTQLYNQAVRTPVGWALRELYRQSGAFYGAWQEARGAVDRDEAGARERSLYRQLVAMDLQTLVVLGDPTVALPPL